MNDNFDGQSGPQRQGDERDQRNGFDSADSLRGASRVNGHTREPVVNFWVALDLLAHRWLWILLGALLCTGGFFLLGSRFIKPKFTASAQLLRYESPTARDFFQSTPMTVETFSGLIRSPDLLQRVGQSVTPSIPPEKLIKRIKVEPQPDSEIIKVSLAAGQPKDAVKLLDTYVKEVEIFTRDYQKQMAETVANSYLKKQLEKMDDDIGTLERTFRGIPSSPQVTNKLNEIGTNLSAALNTSLGNTTRVSPLAAFHTEKLNKALIDLAELTASFHDIHPKIQSKKSEIEALRGLVKAAETNNSSASSYLGSAEFGRFGANVFNPELDIIRTKLMSVEEERVKLVNKRREAEFLAADPPSMVQILSSPTAKSVQTNKRELKISIVSVLGGFLGIGLTLLLVMLVELTDRRLRTAEDLERVTGLPVLSSLGDLRRMPEDSRALWAFRTWTMLQGKLSRSANHGLVCGVTSCAEGEGRSTWIHMLAEAASLAGFRVLTIATKPSTSNGDESENEPEPLQMPDQETSEATETLTEPIATNVLASPAEVTEQLTRTESQPVVHIPLPGWVWNLERRKQWREALNHWRRIDNLVILVELPPAKVAEAVLLGSNLPNLIWLAESGIADAAETRAQLQTLRHARCNLVGAVLNKESKTSLKRRFPRWLGCFLALAVSEVSSMQAQEVSPTAVPAENRSFSIVNPAQKAAWQQHLTLGPGDVVTLSLYGQPDLTRQEVAIAPDGMINYLEATNVLATGRTIDELRTKLDEAVGQYRRSPRTIITPISFKSKKYYMLGKVMAKGVYTLDRPLTVLEAIARARGFENGLVDRNIIDLADFQRSFIMREGKRIPLNFEKLFQEGDLTQNVAIEPGDYVYFPSTNMREVYVVGEVRLPGTVTHTPTLTIIGAISARGGYSERAYKSRVVVVRGSLNNPQLHAVDTKSILEGRGLDFKLQAKDIIYVNSRPFIRVEELAELATTAFIQSLITTFVGVHVVKPIQ